MSALALRQVDWASTHDWFLSFEVLPLVGYSVTVKHDMVAGDVLTFTDFNELYIWAGY